MNVSKSGVVCAAVVWGVLASSALLAAESTMHWYEPHYLPSVDEASNRIQFLSPHFAPMEPVGVSGNYSLAAGYQVSRVDVNKLGINIAFTKSGVVQGTKYFWGWWGGLYDMPTSTPYKDDIVTSVVYADVSFFRIWDGSALRKLYPASWCVLPVTRGAPRNSSLCVNSEADAEGLIDALATLVQASGGALVSGYGMTVEGIPEKEQQKHPGQGGLQVKEVDLDGPARQAGIQVNDILHAINGKPCTGRESLNGAVNDAALGQLVDATVHVEVVRKGNPLALDLHFPGPSASLAQLRKNTAEQARKAPAPGPGTQAAPSPGPRLGIQVRAVTAADVTALNLPRPRGIVVVNVEKGGMADGMQIESGDVILEVNNSEVGDLTFFVQFVRSGAAKSFHIWRKGQALDVAVPESL